VRCGQKKTVSCRCSSRDARALLPGSCDRPSRSTATKPRILTATSIRRRCHRCYSSRRCWRCCHRLRLHRRCLTPRRHHRPLTSHRDPRCPLPVPGAARAPGQPLTGVPPGSCRA
jgi:hypothetical protein